MYLFILLEFILTLLTLNGNSPEKKKKLLAPTQKFPFLNKTPTPPTIRITSYIKN